MYAGRKWERFRVFRDINRYKGEAREEYAKKLIDSIRINIAENGYNPFNDEVRLHVKKEGKSLTINDALTFYKEEISNKRVDVGTVASYKSC